MFLKACSNMKRGHLSVEWLNPAIWDGHRPLRRWKISSNTRSSLRHRSTISGLRLSCKPGCAGSAVPGRVAALGRSVAAARRRVLRGPFNGCMGPRAIERGRPVDGGSDPHDGAGNRPDGRFIALAWAGLAADTRASVARHPRNSEMVHRAPAFRAADGA